MLCIPKKNSTLCTIFNLRQQNDNTWKDVTPFPEQDVIRHDIALRSLLCVLVRPIHNGVDPLHHHLNYSSGCWGFVIYTDRIRWHGIKSQKH